MFDSADRLVYVGISCRLPVRITEHQTSKTWWGEVGRIAVEHFPTRSAALAAETAAIASEDPAYNQTGRYARIARNETGASSHSAAEPTRSRTTGAGELTEPWDEDDFGRTRSIVTLPWSNGPTKNLPMSWTELAELARSTDRN